MISSAHSRRGQLSNCLRACPKRTFIFLFLLVGAVCALSFLSLSSTQAEEPDPPLEEWQIKGTLAALQDENPKVLIALTNNSVAVRALREIDRTAQKHTSKLIELVGHPDESLSNAAIAVLCNMGEIPKLVKASDKLSQGVKDRIVMTASNIIAANKENSSRELTSELLILSEDPSPFIRSTAARLLGSLGKANKNQILQLTELLNDPDLKVRIAAIHALGALGDTAKNETPKLAKFLDDPETEVRIAALHTLSRMGEEASSQSAKIFERLSDQDPEVRIAALEIVGALGHLPKEQTSKLRKLLSDSNSGVSLAAVQAIGVLGEKAAELAPNLIELMINNPDSNMSINIAKAISKLGKSSKKQITRLMELVRDSDFTVRADAMKVLVAIGEGTRVAKLLDNSNKMNRVLALEALRNAGKEATAQADIVAKLLEGSDKMLLIGAIEALVNMGDAGKTHALKLAKLAIHSNQNISSYAIRSLGLMGATDFLTGFIEDQSLDLNARIMAVNALTFSESSIKGKVGKKVVASLDKLLNDDNPQLRQAAINAFGVFGKIVGDETVEKLATFLKDEDELVRMSTVYALQNIGKAARDQVPNILELLSSLKEYNRPSLLMALQSIGGLTREHVTTVADAFGKLEKIYMQGSLNIFNDTGPLAMAHVLRILNLAYENSSAIGEFRFLAHFLGGGDENIEVVISWLGRPTSLPKITSESARKALKLFERIWEPSGSHQNLRRDLERKIAKIIREGTWSADDRALLEQHATNLEEAGSHLYQAVRTEIKKLGWRHFGVMGGTVLLVHALCWRVLLIFYPRYRMIQDNFFWNPWVRRLVGLGYIGFALKWVPYFRRQLFSPFKDSLISDAGLGSFNPQAYFTESKVKSPTSEATKLIRNAIPEIKGQIVLMGDSGLGKSMFLQHLVQTSKRIIAYIPAEKCSQGVMKAIEVKLPGPAKDASFLRNLVYSGAIDLCIDGLNEVTADTRAKVTEFVEGHFRGNILMATQPLEWDPPATACKYFMQPLHSTQIKQFLITRPEGQDEYAKVTGPAYEEACLYYLDRTLSDQQPKEVLDSALKILSNPMDLTLVGQILAGGQQPDLFHLQKQQYEVMVKDYKQSHLGEEFPLIDFSDRVYRMRLEDEVALSESEFAEELLCMARHKMVLARQSRDADGNPEKQWHFRHDKIMEFFILQAFLSESNNDRPSQHFRDPRFRGVYFLLAMTLKMEDADALREQLIQYAADTKDHTVSDTFIQLLRSRKAA